MSRSPVARLRTWAYKVSKGVITFYYRRIWGMQIGDNCRISLSAKLDKTNPKGVVIGDHTLVSFRAAILTHDFPHREHKTTRIGRCCFIGCHAVIMPGITIGDNCIVGAASLVREDVPANSIVAGNPARVIRSGVATTWWGMIPRPGEEGYVPPEAGPGAGPGSGGGSGPA